MGQGGVCVTNQSRRIQQLMNDLVTAQSERDMWKGDAEYYKSRCQGLYTQLKTLEAQIRQLRAGYEVNPHG